MATDDRPLQSITQVVMGGISNPVVLTVTLVVTAVLFGMMIQSNSSLQTSIANSDRENKEAMKEVARELRIMQIHVQDMNAVLIKRGIKTPADDETGPTSGTHP